jgi:hypothetical protein
MTRVQPARRHRLGHALQPCRQPRTQTAGKNDGFHVPALERFLSKCILCGFVLCRRLPDGRVDLKFSSQDTATQESL